MARNAAWVQPNAVFGQASPFQWERAPVRVTLGALKAVPDMASAFAVRVHRVPQEHVSFIPASAWRSSGLIIGMPTYEFKMFPPMAHALDELARKRIVGKKPFRFGSYGWAGGVQKELDGIVSALKWESLELVRERSGELARMVKAHSPTHPL